MQVLWEEAPTVLLHLPGGQRLHDVYPVEFTTLLHVPDGQAMQLLIPVSTHFPGRQREQLRPC